MDAAETEDGASAPKDLDTLHKEILSNIKDSRRHFAAWREEAREDFGFYDGTLQWSPEDKAYMDEQGRVPVVFNRCARTVNAVAGMEVQNRQEVRFPGREQADFAKADLLTSAARWVRDSCDAEDEESEAFLDSLICGMGATETRLDYETDEEGAILVERRDIFEMGVDHRAKKRNFADRRFGYRIIPYTAAEYKAKFIGRDLPKGQFFGSKTEDDTAEFVEERNRYGGKGEGDQPDSGTYEVCQYEYYEVVPHRLVQDLTGAVEEIPEDIFQQRREFIVAQGWKYSESSKPKRVYWRVFLTPTEVLEKEPAPCSRFGFNFITGLRSRNTNTWFGIIRLMKDPQRWANKWLSQIQHILNTQAKAGKVAVEKGAFSNPRKAISEWSDVSKPVEFNEGALSKGKFLQLQPAQYPDGIDRILQYAINAVNDAPGVNVELLGLANRDQPGVLEESRKQAGVTILAQFFDGLRRYRKEQGRTLAAYITEYISDGRIIRINGEYGPETVELLRDKLAMRYDVIVDDAPTSPNMKERTFSVLTAILPMAQQAGVPIPPDLLNYVPLSEDLIQKWKKHIADQSADPAVAQQKELAIAAQTAEVESKMAQAELNKAKAAKELTMMDPAAEDARIGAEMAQKERLAIAEIDSNERIKLAQIAAQEETKRIGQEMASKPAAVVQLGGPEVVSQLTEQLVGGQQMLGQMLQVMMQTNAANSEATNARLEALIQQSAQGFQLLGEAITAPKKVTTPDGRTFTSQTVQ